MKSLRVTMIKKYSFALILIVIFTKTEWALAQDFRVQGRTNQDNRSNFNNNNVDNSAGMQKIQSIKLNYMSDDMHLTSDEAAKFGSVYKQFQNEMNMVLHQKRQNILNSQKNAQDIVNDNFDYDSKILSIKKHYNEEFSKILPPDKVLHFWKSERTFNEEMIKRLKSKRGNDGN